MSTAPRQRRAATADPSPAHDAPEGDAPAADAPPGGAEFGAVRVIKKYPNRRLYDTRTSSYITLAEVKDRVMACEQFVVIDAKTGEDLTRSILLQIILEEETVGMPMFSTQSLAQIIRFYGHTMQGMMGNYLDRNIQSFIDLQSRLAETSVKNLQHNPMQSLMGGYLEQSQKLFQQMQEQMTKQAETLMGNLGTGLGGTKRED
ncbi:polyhydroxyalkanoate synthesis repressor PhaR [Aquabacterium fontiphilum]|jgi:polyhydroxyalkanoate synthesis repressor PhaR|uniref:polyhydroxyalkanoate synthesis repressor PhaR n=1 Tax=Aquabacterium fontiphilum TaxID=450365 RepID=UPI001376E63B|nr:polyhydroxyalkanoate synthesis repressor PhaR [Aquabacterium fontiphilum]NBD20015.1 polyhydroxyalkanoate synthesis repressor PhaR [Aquabacterium fontiphilum]